MKLLVNNLGGYYLERYDSRYRGFFVSLDRMFKIIDQFSESGKTSMPRLKNSLVYILRKKQEIEVFFDIRESYDMRDWGKEYKVYAEKSVFIVEFVKRTDSREDNSSGAEEYKVYVAVKCDKIEENGRWLEKKYKVDEERGSFPASRWVYGLRISGKRIVFSVSDDKEKAMKECEHVSKNYEALLKKENKLISKDDLKERVKDSVKSFMVCKDKDFLYAGFPWFFQEWSRDELIGLKGLMLCKEYMVVKDILLRWVALVKENGRLPNRFPPTETGNADSIGWLFVRIDDFLEATGEKYINANEKKYIITHLKEAAERLLRSCTKFDFDFCNKNETWMDTSLDGVDIRDGARIEIQALRLRMYALLYKLTKQKVYKQLEEKLLLKVRKHFFNGQYLNDGLGDNTIRPNLFIAGYVYPSLLTKEEWKRCIDFVMPSLWLEWGGLSTIDKASPLYTEVSTGEDVRSYHRGDSWFWVNNYAALLMKKVDEEYFKDYIDKITEASVKEFKEKGFSAEISSAIELRSEGCVAQLWSCSSLLELLAVSDFLNV